MEYFTSFVKSNLEASLVLGLGLVAAGGLPRNHAEEAGWAIHRSNPKFVTKKVVQTFMQKLARMRSV